MVFATPEALAAYAEPIDVQEGSWLAAWDSNGQRLQFSIVPRAYRGLYGRPRSAEAVSIEASPAPSRNDPAIQELIRPRLEAIGLDPGQLAGAQLIEFAIAHVPTTT